MRVPGLLPRRWFEVCLFWPRLWGGPGELAPVRVQARTAWGAVRKAKAVANLRRSLLDEVRAL